jgi:predicted dehydrogenase
MAAKDKGIHAAVGLQARSGPTFKFLRKLIADGYVGKVLSTSLIGSGMGMPVLDRSTAYSADERNHANLFSIPFGHAIDAVNQVLGNFAQLNALVANRRTTFTLAETGEEMPMTSADQAIVVGVLMSGTVISMHYRGGMTRGGTDMLWEINGTEGDLQMTGFAGHMEMYELSIKGARGDQKMLEPLAVPRKLYTMPADTAPFAVNVGEAYRLLATDIETGSRLCPTFDDGVEVHRLLDRINTAAKTGRRAFFGA